MTKHSLALSVLVPCALLTGVAQAQEPVTLEEIIVTAQKREQRLIDVPLSVTAMTGTELAERGVSNLLQAQYAVPGLTLSEFGPGQQRAQLRGVGTQGGSQGLATVGFYLDEMPINIGAGAGLDVRLLDMERVEVLRGPQPTLYGEGSMGGTIRYVTAKPDLNEFLGRVAGSWGSIEDGSETYRAEGMLNLPLVADKLALRLVAGHENLGGWIDTASRADVNEAKITTVRASLLFQPVDGLSVSLLALHQEQEQGYQNFASKDRTTTTVYPSRNDDRYDLANLVVSYDLGAVTLLSTTGYLKRKPNSGFDLTSYFVPVLEGSFGVPPGFITSVGQSSSATTRMWTEEVRLTSNGDGPLRYTVGAYYRDPKTEQQQITLTAPGALPFELLGGQLRNESEAWAVFGDVSYAFTDRLEVLVGARYFEDERSFDNTTTQFGFTSTEVRAAKFDTVNPRFNVSYKTSDDGIVFFNAAKGFRSGGINSFSAGLGAQVEPTFGPEKLWSYEVGTKQQLLDRRLLLEASVYYNEWDDFQAQTVVPGSVIAIFANSGKASGPGADLSLTLRPIKELTLSATVGYTDMEYDTNSPDRYKGDTMDMVAPWTWSTSLGYERPLAGDMTFIARADYLHTDGYELTLRNFIFPPGTSPFHQTDKRDVINARVGVNFGTFAAYLFVDNLSDDGGTLYPPVGTVLEPILSQPRTVGIELRADF